MSIRDQLGTRKNQVIAVVTVVVVVAVVGVVVGRGGDDGQRASLCSLASSDAGDLLADGESDIAVVASRLRDRADLIDSARDGQEAAVADALDLVATSMRQLADATEAGDGGATLSELTATLTKSAELEAAQQVLDEAIANQCGSSSSNTVDSESSQPVASSNP